MDAMTWWDWLHTTAGVESILGILLGLAVCAVSGGIRRLLHRGIHRLMRRDEARTQALIGAMYPGTQATLTREAQRAEEHRQRWED